MFTQKIYTQHRRDSILYFIILAVIYIVQLSPYLDIFPLFDAGMYSGCYSEISLKNIFCNNHISPVYITINYVLAKIFNYEIFYLNFFNTLIGVYGIYVFYKLLNFFLINENNFFILLFTLLLVFNSNYLSSTLFLTSDLLLSVSCISFIYYFLKDKNFLAIFFAIVLVLSKDPGIFYFNFFLISFFIFCFFKNTDIKKVKNSIFFFIFINLFYFLIIFLKNQIYIDSSNLQLSFREIVSMLLRPRPSNFYLMNIINFKWVMTLYLLLFLFFLKKDFLNNIKFSQKPFLIIILFFIFLFFSHLILGMSLNLRYFLLYELIFIFLIIYSISLIKFKKIKILIIFVFCSLSYLSTNYSNDFLSKNIFGTFEFGKNRLLSVSTPRTYRYSSGRDSLFYNLQFYRIHQLLHQILLTNENIDRYVFNNYAAHHISMNIDKETSKRTFSINKNLKKTFTYELNEVLSFDDKNTYLLFDLPNMPLNDLDFEKLNKKYKIQKFTQFDKNKSYKINYYLLSK